MVQGWITKNILTTLLFSSFEGFIPDIWYGLIGGLIGGLLSGSETTSFRLKGMIEVWKQQWCFLVTRALGSAVVVGGVVTVNYVCQETLAPDTFSDWLGAGLYGLDASLCGFLLTILIMSGKMAALQHISSVPTQPWWHRFFPQGLKQDHLLVGIIVGLLLGLNQGLLGGLNLWLTGGLSAIIASGELRFTLNVILDKVLKEGAFFGCIGVFLSILQLGKKSEIELAEIIVLSGKRLRQSFMGTTQLAMSGRIVLLIFLLSGLNAGLDAGFAEGVNAGISAGLSNGLVDGLSLGAAYWILFGFWASFSRETLDDHLRTKPNQGIRRSLRNALLLGWFAGIVCFLTALLKDVLYFAPEQGLDLRLSQQLSYLISDWIIVSYTGALLMALFMGGLTCLRHLLLRIQLRHLGVIPRHYVRFLNDAARRVVLYRDGGGYRFMHRLLLDYFADMEVESARHVSKIGNKDCPRAEKWNHSMP